MYLVISSSELLLDVLLCSSSEGRQGRPVHAISQPVRRSWIANSSSNTRYVLPEGLKLIHLSSL